MQNDNKMPLYREDYSSILLNVQENEKMKQKYMIFLLFVIK